jgi:hypothetical protein
MDNATPRPGIIEGASRVLRELLRTPRFRETARIVLRELDPENAPLLVKALTGEDPELLLGLVASAPALANTVIGAARELLAQLLVYPPGLLPPLTSGLLAELDAEALGETLALACVLQSRMQGEVESETDVLAAVGRGWRRGLAAHEKSSAAALTPLAEHLGKAITAGVAQLNAAAEENDPELKAHVERAATGLTELAAQNPAFVADVLGPLAQAWRGVVSPEARKGQGDD